MSEGADNVSGTRVLVAVQGTLCFCEQQLLLMLPHSRSQAALMPGCVLCRLICDARFLRTHKHFPACQADRHLQPGQQVNHIQLELRTSASTQPDGQLMDKLVFQAQSVNGFTRAAPRQLHQAMLCSGIFATRQSLNKALCVLAVNLSTANVNRETLLQAGFTKV